jgi:hypothetical protein
MSDALRPHQFDQASCTSELVGSVALLPFEECSSREKEDAAAIRMSCCFDDVENWVGVYLALCV